MNGYCISEEQCNPLQTIMKKYGIHQNHRNNICFLNCGVGSQCNWRQMAPWPQLEKSTKKAKEISAQRCESSHRRAPRTTRVSDKETKRTRNTEQLLCKFQLLRAPESETHAASRSFAWSHNSTSIQEPQQAEPHRFQMSCVLSSVGLSTPPSPKSTSVLSAHPAARPSTWG